MPNFGGSRGGFWYRPAVTPTAGRNGSPKRILIVKEYGTKSVANSANNPTATTKGLLYKYYARRLNDNPAFRYGGEGAGSTIHGGDGSYTYPIPNADDLYAYTQQYTDPRVGIKTARYSDTISIQSYVIKLCAQELGFVADIITCHDYDALINMSSQLVNTGTYSQIWDMQQIGFLNTSAKSIYKTFLQNGGALFLCGENRFYGSPGYTEAGLDKTYWLRNDDICTFVRDDLGGGGVYQASNAPLLTNIGNDPLAAIASEFRLSDSAKTGMGYNLTGGFTNIGTGTKVLSLLPGFYSRESITQGRTILGSTTGQLINEMTYAAMWKTGSLTNASTGACIICLEGNIFDDARLSFKMTKNFILSLNSK